MKIFLLVYFFMYLMSMSICDNISKELQDVLQKSNKMKKSKGKLSSKIKSENIKTNEMNNEICSCAMRWQTKGKARNKIQEGREVISSDG